MQSNIEMSESFTWRDSNPKIAKVTKVYPEANMVDLLFLDGSVFKKVHVVVPYASNKTGGVCLSLPKYDVPIENRTDALVATSKDTENDVMALVIFISGMSLLPIVVGFIFPEESEVLCSTEQEGNEKGTQHIWKHQSNFYTRVDDAGDVEISHPSGVLIKIGKNTDRTSILNYDRLIRPFKWKNPDTGELSPAPYIFIKHPSGTYFMIDPDGNVTENCVGDVTRIIKGTLTEEIDGNKIVKTGGTISETATVDCTRQAGGVIFDRAPSVNHSS
jgi:hypothetical protein